MTDIDTNEFTTADRERVHRLKQFMLDRGYMRHPEHGFWTLQAPSASKSECGATSAAQ